MQEDASKEEYSRLDPLNFYKQPQGEDEPIAVRKSQRKRTSKIKVQDTDTEESSSETESAKPEKSSGNKRKANQSVGARRRELNRRNAKKSRQRQKFRVERLVLRVATLEQQNRSLREVCDISVQQGALPAKPSNIRPTLQESDYSLMSSLARSKTSFCITDPHEADNPIKFASDTFLKMTGYSAREVIGRNCRMLQGPGTKKETTKKISAALKQTTSISITILNYKKDGKPFWNQLHITPLHGADGNIVHYLGIQREITVRSIPYAMLTKQSENVIQDVSLDSDSASSVQHGKSSSSMQHFSSSSSIERYNSSSSIQHYNSSSSIQRFNSSSSSQLRSLTTDMLARPQSIKILSHDTGNGQEHEANNAIASSSQVSPPSDDVRFPEFQGFDTTLLLEEVAKDQT